MKRSTLILLLIAAVLGVGVYFLEIKDGKPRDAEEKSDTSKPAFSFTQEDIAAITLTREGQTVTLEERDGKWTIIQPVNAAADQSAVNSLASSLSSARVERTITASADDMSKYGLTEPAVTLEVKLKSGEQRKVRLGGKDFSGLSVYAQLDEANDVALMPASLLTSADKSLDDLRDSSVLGAAQFEINSLDLNNENGQLALAKEDTNWVIRKPFDAPADQGEVSIFLNALTSAKAEEFVSETADDLAKYGLDKPKITLTTRLQGGGERVLTVGSKAEDSYYTKASDRPQVFKIESSLYDKLNIKASELRDKQIVRLDKDALQKIEIKNPNLKLVAEKNSEGKWIIKEPADKKDKEANANKVFDPLEDNKATEILDKPAAAVTAKLAKRPVEVRLTGKDGKVTVLTVSEADGSDVYVQVQGRPGVYKVGKAMLESLSFKADEIANQS